MVFSFRRLNHNLDFSFLHIKNPVGDFSPTGFVEQPQILAYSIFFFGVYLWTNIQLSILLIELGSLGYILIVLYEWIQKLRMKKIEK